MVTRLVQNTCIHNTRKTIHNYLRDVPNQRKRHLNSNYNSIMPAITKDKIILKLQSPFEHNDFIGKLVIKIKQMLCIKQT